MRSINNGIILFILAVSGLLCAGQKDNLVAASLLNQAQLESAWQIQLPLNNREKLKELHVFEDYLYALTDRNFFFCIDRKTGDVRSMMQIAVPELPIQPPLHFENKSVFLVGQQLKVFNPQTGVIERSVHLQHLGSNHGGITRNAENIYVCGSDKRLYVFNAEKGVLSFMASADNDSVIFSVFASDETVWFGTRAGNIIAMEANAAKKIWQYNLTGQMVTPLVMDGEFIYAAGLDTKVVKLHADNGKEAWAKPFFAGGKIEEPLILGKTCIYVFTAASGLYAVDKKTGQSVWNAPEGFAVLAENGPLAYIYAKPGVMIVMDNNSGKEQVSVNVAGVSHFAINATDSSIYFAKDDGRIQAASVVQK